MKYVAERTFANLGCNKAGGNVICLWWKNDGNGKRRKTDGSGSGETDRIVQGFAPRAAFAARYARSESFAGGYSPPATLAARI